MSKPKLEWAEKGEAEDFEAAVKFLSLLRSDTKAKALVKSIRNFKLVEHAAKDLLRARTSRFCRVTSRTWTRI